MQRALIACLATLTIAAAAPATRDSRTLDQGSFKIYRNYQALGAETFEFVHGHDSLLVHARQYLMIQTSRGDEPLERSVDALYSFSDYALHEYQSSRTLGGTTTMRGLVVADTHYVAYRQDSGLGEGDSRVLPPGRMFVMDAQVVTLFDLIGRSLHGSSFASRPLNLLALGPRDTMLDARVVSLGNETIRWGARPVVARKLHIVADDETTFTLWIGPQGQLLRLSEPVGGLRAERDPPPVKRRPAPPPPPRPTPGG